MVDNKTEEKRINGVKFILDKESLSNIFSIVEVDDNLTPLNKNWHLTILDDKCDWVLVIPKNAYFNPMVFENVLQEVPSNPDISIWYFDELIGDPCQNSLKAVVKPDFDLTFLLSSAYISLPIMVKKSLLVDVIDSLKIGNSAMWIDLCLRGYYEGAGIKRCSEFAIIHKSKQLQPSLKDFKKVIKDFISKDALEFEIKEGLSPTSISLWRIFDDFPSVTIIIPTCQSLGKSGKPFVFNLLDSIQKSNWPMNKISVFVGDDIDKQCPFNNHWSFRLTWLHTPRKIGEPFNYSKKMNFLWRQAETELLIMMNDDIEIVNENWIQALATFALEDDVGGVGARLIHPNHTIQHIGCVGGLCGVLAHANFNFDKDEMSYQDWGIVQKEWSAVTGAIFATRKTVLESVNGFDENFMLEFNDIDLCLRMKLMGYRIVYNPFAELVHHEKASRGQRRSNPSEMFQFLCRWNDFIKDDPSYSPLLSRDDYAIKPDLICY